MPKRKPARSPSIVSKTHEGFNIHKNVTGIPNSPFTCFGIDSSPTKYGIAIISGGLLYTKRVKFPTSHSYKEYYESIRNLLTSYSPDISFIEGYAYAAPGRIVQAGEIGGIIRLAYEQHARDLFSVTPMSLKAFLENGKIKKKEIVDYAAKNFNIHAANDDEADAAILALMAAHRLHQTKGLTERAERGVFGTPAHIIKTQFLEG